MTVHLRGHHLLCILTYIGKGYTPLFVENYDRIAAQLSRGVLITLVNGPDDICAALLCETNCHCHKTSVISRDQLALEQINALLNLHLQQGSQFILSRLLLQNLRDAFRDHKIRRACENCQWAKLCTDVAQNSVYKNVKIQTRNLSSLNKKTDGYSKL